VTFRLLLYKLRKVVWQSKWERNNSFLLVSSLFNDAFSVTRLYKDGKSMIKNWKGFGRKRSWPNFKVLSRQSPGGNEENHENLNQDSRPLGPRIETGTFRIRSRNVNHSTTTSGSFFLLFYGYISTSYSHLLHAFQINLLPRTILKSVGSVITEIC
jgi:hypothetical protein